MAPTYLVRDRFSTPVNPLVDANASDAGYRDVYGTGFYAAGGRLRGGNNSTEGKVVYKVNSGGAGFSRVSGRTFCAVVSPDDGDSDVSIWLAETAGTLNGYGLRVTGKTFEIVEPDGNTVVVVNVDGNQSAKPTQYLFGITLNDTFGATYWVSAAVNYTPTSDWEIPAYPNARTLFVSTLGTFSTVYPTVRANSGFTYPGGVAIEDVRLFDVSAWSAADGMALVADRFDRANSTTSLGTGWTAEAGTWGISSNQAYSSAAAFNGRAYMNATVADVWVVAEITTGSSLSDWFGLLLRRSNNTNWIRLHNDGGTNIKFQSWKSGAFDTTFSSTNASFATSTTYRFLVGCKGNQFSLFINGDATVLPITSEGTSTYNGSTRFGIFGDSASGQRWNNFAVYPMSFALGTDFQDGAVPVTPQISIVLVSDLFTDAADTNLTAHTPTLAPGSWSVENGTWKITNNAAVVNAAATDNHAYIDAGKTDVQVSANIIMPSSMAAGQLRNGFILRRNGNNYVLVRLFMDDVNQLNADEIEVIEIIGGNGSVVHKCYLGNLYTASTTYALKCQVIGDLLQVYLNGIHQMSVYLSDSALLTGTQFGLYAESGVVATSWDSFEVRLLNEVYGDTFTLPLTLLDGSATGTSPDSTANGDTFTMPLSLIAGSATVSGDGLANGDILTIAASLLGGSATGGGNISATANGDTLSLVFSLVAGSASMEYQSPTSSAYAYSLYYNFDQDFA